MSDAEIVNQIAAIIANSRMEYDVNGQDWRVQRALQAVEGFWIGYLSALLKQRAESLLDPMAAGERAGQ